MAIVLYCILSNILTRKKFELGYTHINVYMCSSLASFSLFVSLNSDFPYLRTTVELFCIQLRTREHIQNERKITSAQTIYHIVFIRERVSELAFIFNILQNIRQKSIEFSFHIIRKMENEENCNRIKFGCKRSWMSLH